MKLRLEARPEPSRVALWMAPLLATFATLCVGFIVFTALGRNPLAAFDAFFIAPVATRYGVAELLLKARGQWSEVVERYVATRSVDADVVVEALA